MNAKRHGNFLAVGDLEFRRERPDTIFDLSRPVLKAADVLFGQLEQSFTNKGAMQVHIHAIPRRPPEDVAALSSAGFTVLSLAGNHSLDWGPDALLDTRDNLEKQGIRTCGVGVDVKEARKPLIMEKNGVTFAFLAYASVMPLGYHADVDKAGNAPIRVHTLYREVDLGQPGSPAGVTTYCERGDLAAMIEEVKKARPLADVVIFSHHAGLRPVRARLADYQRDAAYAAIDAGADIVLAHHAHILKGIEVYKSKPIFHGLGNFAFDSPVHPTADKAMYDKFQALYGWKRDPSYSGYGFPEESRMTMVARFQVDSGKVERVSFMPAYINKNAQPEILNASDPRFEQVAKYMEAICGEARLNTKFSVEGKEIVVITS